MKYVLIWLIAGCGHVDHMREDLQKRNPDCVIDADLSMHCPTPLDKEKK